MATITELRGNLFESRCQVLVNTVNCAGVMGRGIALEFKNRFPEMFQQYRQYSEQGLIQIGKLHLWRQNSPWILNFPTKQHWRHPSKIEYIEAGLKKLAETYHQRGISSIAFPQLGSSLGGLNWLDQVRPTMLKYLKPLDVQVEIYEYDPFAPDPLFDALYQRICRFAPGDYTRELKVSSIQAERLAEAVQSGKLTNMRGLQEIKGVGEKTIERLYTFVAKPYQQLEML
jgi:O-acetyl-ADP-ribose deacetylase (regulator of RNase III)